MDVSIHSRKKRSPITNICKSIGINDFNISQPFITSATAGVVTAYSTYNPCDLVLCILGPIILFWMLSQPPPIPPQPDCIPSGGTGCTPPDFQPQPGSPGGGGIPSGNTLILAQNLLSSLGLLGVPVAVFPPYRDGSIFSPLGFRTFATIHTDDDNPR